MPYDLRAVYLVASPQQERAHWEPNRREGRYWIEEQSLPAEYR
jgi:hypothetical protein